ncbi:MAG: InlB B-repeat-containing protein [Clostridia bacterium]|nr:InlB B-repeat-containing protein [Clostridia bacterium]
MSDNDGRFHSENYFPQQNDANQNQTGFYTALYGSYNPVDPPPAENAGRAEPADNDWLDLDIEKELPKSVSAKKIIPVAVAAGVVLLLIVIALAAQGKKRPSSSGTPAVSPRDAETTAAAQDDLPAVAHVYFDANGGRADYTERTGCIGDEYGQLPGAKKDGCEFVGWFTERDGGEPVTPYSVIHAADETVYAHWTETATATETTVPKTNAEPITQRRTEPPTKPSTQPRTESASTSAVTRSNTVLLQNSDMIVYSPAGFDVVDLNKLLPEENVSYHLGSTGVIGNDSYYTNLDCKEYVGDGGHTAAWFAETDAADISTSSYTRTVNGLTFSCVDYKNENGWYGTVLYYISDGHLIEIIASSGARSSIWPMLEACVFGQ